MLQSIRETLLGWVGYIIVGLIILVFALWGVQSYLGGGTLPPVAEVNGVEISQNQYQNALRTRQQQVRQIYGDVPASEFEKDSFKQGVLKSLVRETVVTGTANKRGYEVSDAMVLDRIQSIPQFQENGVFSPVKYNQTLQASRLSPLGYEQSLRQEIKVGQVGSTIASTALVPAVAIKAYSGLEQQTRSMRMLTIAKASVIETVTVSDAEAQTYYDENLSVFMSPEQVRVDYLLLDDAALAAGVNVNDDILRNFYDEDPISFRSSESRNVRHILYRLGESATPEQEASVKKTAEDMYQRLGDEGADFAELATQFSQDELSAAKGGELGEIFLGDLHPSLERAIFALEQGSYSAPVRTALGYQIAKVDSVVGGDQLAFEQAKDQVETEYRARQADTLFGEATENLVDISFQNDDLRSTDVGIEVQTTDWFSSQGGPGIASDPAVVAAAFGDQVFNRKENSELIDLQNGAQVVMRFVEGKAPAQLPLAQVKEQILQVLKEGKARELTAAQGVEMVNSLESGSSLEDLAAVQQLEVITNPALSRRTRDLDPAIVTQTFRMPAPQDGSAQFTTLSLRNGDQVVLALDTVNQITGEFSEANATTLSSAYGLREVEAYFAALEKNSSVSILEENLGAELVQ